MLSSYALRTRIAPTLSAVVVLLSAVACSATEQEPASSLARTAATSAIPESSTISTSTTTSTPPTLDTAGEAWFDAFCTGVSGLRATMAAVATPTGFDVSTPVAYQNGLAQTYYAAADAFAALGTALAATPSPSFDGGGDFATEMSNTMISAGAALRTDVDTFASTPVVDLASVDAANLTLATSMQATVSGLGSELAAIEELPAGIRADVLDLPGCAVLAP